MAARAIARQVASEVCRRAKRTAGTAGVDIDSDVIPSPHSTSAMSGSEADSPQTPTGVPEAAPARAVASTSLRTAGCQRSMRSDSAPSSRSAANVYWARSFVPIDTKSKCCSTLSAHSATAGTSTMTPILALAPSPASSARRRTSAASPAVEIIGAMTHASVSGQSSMAAARALSWCSIRCGTERTRR